jgi:hypothetical protein
VVIELSSYALETLREDKEYVLYRGRRAGGQPDILVATPVSEYPAAGVLDRLEHEYTLRDELDPEWAASPLALVRQEERTMLVREDPGGNPSMRSSAPRWNWQAFSVWRLGCRLR